MATVKQCLENKTSSEIIEIIKIIFDNLETDCSLSYILSYVVYVYNFNTENLVLEQLPGESVLKDNLWLFEYDKNQTNLMMENILEEFNAK